MLLTFFSSWMKRSYFGQFFERKKKGSGDWLTFRIFSRLAMTMGLTIREAYPVSLKGILDQEPIKKKKKNWGNAHSRTNRNSLDRGVRIPAGKVNHISSKRSESSRSARWELEFGQRKKRKEKQNKTVSMISSSSYASSNRVFENSNSRRWFFSSDSRDFLQCHWWLKIFKKLKNKNSGDAGSQCFCTKKDDLIGWTHFFHPIL